MVRRERRRSLTAAGPQGRAAAQSPGGSRSFALPILKGQLTRQVAQDAANTIRVQAGKPADLGERLPFALEPQDLVVFRRAQGQHAFPKVRSLSQLAGTILRLSRQTIQVGVGQVLLALDGRVLLAIAVDE